MADVDAQGGPAARRLHARSLVRIGLLAPPFVRVPPKRYGGTERVVAALADALVERGHDVTLFASSDSETRANLVPTIGEPAWDDTRFAENGPFWTLGVERAYRRADDLDVMHNHSDFYAYPLARRAPFPTVTTQHWRMDLPELVPLYEEYAEQPLVAVSKAQRRPLPQANWVATVYHGLAADLYHAETRRGRYLVFCGRLAREKGAHTAIQAAIHSGIPIKVAGRRPTGLRTDEEARHEREYWADVLRPLLRHPLVEHLGEIGDDEKQELYGGALATLFPISWPEPFGLVLIESLACGTPVIATPVGSVPEVIADGVTGYHCRSVEDYVHAIRRVEDLDRARCRAEFDARFTAEAMAAAYERVYATVVAEGRPVRRAVTIAPSRRAREGANGHEPVETARGR